MAGKVAKKNASLHTDPKAESDHRTLREEIGITEEEFRSMGEIGAMYYQQGNLDHAQTIFEGLVEVNPNSVDAQSALGALYTRKRQDDKALEHLNRAIELNDVQIAPHVNRAEVLLREQRVDEAMMDLKKAIELDPQEEDMGANRARAMVLGIQQALEAKGVM